MTTVAELIEGYQPASLSTEAAAFARALTAGAGPTSLARAKAFLFALGRLGAFATSVGLELRAEVCLHDAVIERFVLTEGRRSAPATVRTLRSNLLAVRRSVSTRGPGLAPLARERSKAPYSAAEMTAYGHLATTQPTAARRCHTLGLLALGAGAGLMGGDLRGVRGTDVVGRGGGVVVEVGGRRPRRVPVLAAYHGSLRRAADFARGGYVIGGRRADRRTVTTPLVSSLAGGKDLAPLDTGRLRATWLVACAELIGLRAFMDAAGITCSQRLGDLVAALAPVELDQAVAVLGARG